MPSLVAIALPGGPAFVDALRRAWDDGDAAAPVDPRLPAPAAAALLDALAPEVVHDETGRRRRPGGRPVEPGDAVVVATSGTTGRPRGVVLTHDAVRASALASSARLGTDPARDRWLACLPLAHVGGLSVVTRALVTRTPLVVHPGFDAAAAEAEARAGATLASLVPTALSRLDAGLFRKILVGGSADWRERAPNVVRTYGLTETGSGVAYDGVPLDGVEVRTAADGEVLVRGPVLLRCYRDGTDPKTPDGWLPTGDAGAFEGGRLVVRGRRADVVVTGGEKVWPDAVEAAVRLAPGVADVAVAGRPDPDWGERVVAFVVPADPAAPPTLDAVRASAKERLPAYAAPRELVLVAALPRTALGKVRRSAL